MGSRVGAKGNIVIEKEIREQLGVQPGWEAVQVARDGYVQIHFLPPPTPGMSAGVLKRDVSRPDLWTADALHEATERALTEAAIDEDARGQVKQP